jgi:hypothetical protein
MDIHQSAISSKRRDMGIYIYVTVLTFLMLLMWLDIRSNLRVGVTQATVMREGISDRINDKLTKIIDKQTVSINNLRYREINGKWPLKIMYSNTKEIKFGNSLPTEP